MANGHKKFSSKRRVVLFNREDYIRAAHKLIHVNTCMLCLKEAHLQSALLSAHAGEQTAIGVLSTAIDQQTRKQARPTVLLLLLLIYTATRTRLATEQAPQPNKDQQAER